MQHFQRLGGIAAAAFTALGLSACYPPPPVTVAGAPPPAPTVLPPQPPPVYLLADCDNPALSACTPGC